MTDMSETLISLAEAARTLPGRPNIATLWRWRTAGVRGVTLETVTVGGRRYTSREALARFVAATTAAADGEPVARPQTPRQREAAIRAAERELDRLGV